MYNPDDIIQPADGASQSDDGSLTSSVGRLMQVFLGLLGVLALLGIVIGTPVGLYLIATTSSEETAHHAGQPKSLQGLYKAFMIFAGLAVICSAIGAVFGVYEYFQVYSTVPFFTPRTFIGSAIGGLAGLGYFVSAIIYLFWLGRAARNLSYHHHMKSSPEWLVWGHIIPVYNLIHPILTYPAFWNEVATAHHVHEDERAKGQKIIIGFYIFDLIMDLGNSVLPRINDSLAAVAVQQMFLFNSIHQAVTVVAGIFIIMFVKMVTEKMEPQH